MFEELFVFDVQNDREGVVVALIDDVTNHPVPVLLGMTYVNLRKMHLVEEDVDWDCFQRFRTDPPTLVRHSDEHVLVGRPTACPGTLLLPGGEDVVGAPLSKPFSWNSSCKQGTNVIPRLDGGGGSRNSSAPFSSSTNFGDSKGCPVTSGSLVRDRKKDDFLNYVERGNSNNVPLYDFQGQALTSAQVSISWSFHPYRLSAREQQIAAANSECRVCKRKDIPSPNDCMCADEVKEKSDEDFVREKMLDVGKEVHTLELMQREKNPKWSLPTQKEKTTFCC